MGVLAVAHEAASAAVVRHLIAGDLKSNDVEPESIDDVVLVASELVGNAVMHTPAALDQALDVCWDFDGNAVLVSVMDASHDLPRQQSVQVEATSGRGLAIVAALAQDWGVRCGDAGKQVWARIPIHRVQSARQAAQHS